MERLPESTTTSSSRGTSAHSLSGHRRGRRGAFLGLLASLGLLSLLVLAGCDTGSKSTNTKSGGSAVATVAVPPSANDLQQTVINVIRTVQPSVVEVISQGGQGEAIGSGEIINKNGDVVTNDHVVEGFSSFSVVLSSGQSLPAQLVGKSPQDDLAVLKVSMNNPQVIGIADSSKVQVGQFVIALGSPLGLAQSATFGIVSALNRSASEGQNGPAQQLTGLIQTSAPINPGNSGGALVNLQGQLIGIPTLGAVDPNGGGAANGIGFAIPSDRMQFIAQQLIAHGQVTNTGQGFLGVQGEDVTPQLAAAYNLPVQSGVLVAGFANDASGKSPAQAAGVQTGDIITAVDNQQIASNGDLSAALISKQPGTKVTLTVHRGSSQKNITVTLGERPAKS